MAVPLIDSVPVILVSTCILLTILLYLFSTRKFNHWKNKGIPFVKPIPVFGNVLDIFILRQSIGDVCRKIYESTTEPFIGLFVCDEPYLLVRDPQLVKSILIKDFGHFIDRTMTENKRDDPIGSHILFILKNPDWKEIRRKISPVFTSGRMKLMYKLIQKAGTDMQDYLGRHIDRSAVIESRELCAKYTTDAITSTSFGIDANCFQNEHAEFRQISRRIFNWDIFMRGVQTTCYFVAPTLVKLFRMQFIDKRSGDFLRNVFWSTMTERQKNNFVRNDLLDILIELKDNDKIVDDPYKLDGDKLVAQAVQFFVAGYETSSSTISFALYELALNPEIQKRVRTEIFDVRQRHQNEINYDALKDMIYVEMCIKETLRKYPVLPFLDRRCTRDYQIPGTNKIIERGTAVFISSYGLHYDANYFPDPERFDPERFSAENIGQMDAYTYLPFGDGPRNCIGARFGMLSSKSGVAHILSKYQVDICPETQNPMKFNPKGFLIAPIKGLKLQFTKL